MIGILHLTLQLRKELKKPLGILFSGSLDKIMEMLRTLIEKEKPTKIVTVGDQVSKDLIAHAFLPDILIIDNKIMRKKIPPISATADKIVTVKNPAGTITDEAWLAIKNASRRSERTKIIVDGEEDLLALVAILTTPETSLILYGQPHQGVVAVKATAEMKRKIQGIINAMKTVKDTIPSEN